MPKETPEEALRILSTETDIHPIRRHWLEVAAGLKAMPENIGKRGKDKGVRAIPGSKTLATRYYERTGRRIDQEMEAERDMVEIMFQAAAEMEDPEARFAALDKAQKAMSAWNRNWTPYLEQKLGTLQSTDTVEGRRTLEDVYEALEHQDEDPES